MGAAAWAFCDWMVVLPRISRARRGGGVSAASARPSQDRARPGLGAPRRITAAALVLAATAGHPETLLHLVGGRLALLRLRADPVALGRRRRAVLVAARRGGARRRALGGRAPAVSRGPSAGVRARVPPGLVRASAARHADVRTRGRLAIRPRAVRGRCVRTRSAGPGVGAAGRVWRRGPLPAGIRGTVRAVPREMVLRRRGGTLARRGGADSRGRPAREDSLLRRHGQRAARIRGGVLALRPRRARRRSPPWGRRWTRVPLRLGGHAVAARPHRIEEPDALGDPRNASRLPPERLLPRGGSRRPRRRPHRSRFRGGCARPRASVRSSRSWRPRARSRRAGRTRRFAPTLSIRSFPILDRIPRGEPYRIAGHPHALIPNFSAALRPRGRPRLRGDDLPAAARHVSAVVREPAGLVQSRSTTPPGRFSLS